MPAPLDILRSRLRTLGRRRATVRVGTAVATAGLVLLATLAALAAIDVTLMPQVAARGVLILAAAFVVGWFVAVWLAPEFFRREDETDLALLVEGKHALEGDLVAALQFQSPGAERWGSPQLERAVVGYVDEASRELPVLEGFSWRPLPSRSVAFAVALAVAVALIVIFPAYAKAFFGRLLLTDAIYPTRTRIVSVAINGNVLNYDGSRPLRAPAGLPLTFVVVAAGETPTAGVVQLAGDGGGKTELTLAAPNAEGAAEKKEAAGLPSRGPASYSATLDRFAEPVTFVVAIGDATTPRRRIEIVPRPAVTLSLAVSPPAYAKSAAPPPPAAGVRTAYVLEGSDVTVTIRATKPLKSAALTAGKKTYPLKPSGEDGRAWRLPAAGTPFAAVSDAVAFTVAVIDEDGLTPAEPVAGSVRLRPDRPPRVAAAAALRRVLPSAKPLLTYGASDDFGIKSVRADLTVRRADGSEEKHALPLPVKPATAGKTAATVVRGERAIDLSRYALAKGDQVEVTVSAEDARGNRPGRTASSEPLVFEVTDREGLLAGLLEADEEGAERLDAIIRRELGIGSER